MKKDESIELSIQEQMYIYTKNYSKMFPKVVIIFGSLLILSLCIFQNLQIINLLTDPSSKYLILYAGTIAVISGTAIAWFGIKGKNEQSQLRSIIKKYTNDSYFLALGLTSHKNDENIITDFYDMCLSVFPELKQADKESLKETGKTLELEYLTLELDNGDYTFTVGDISNKKFIIKYFQKTPVNYEQLNEYLKITQDEYGGNIFRLICLAKNFDNNILKKYTKLMESKKIPLDLILVTDNGFSGLKISEIMTD
jgi:hypothetical protein